MHHSTARTKIRRLPDLANHDRDMLHAIVDESYVCHIAFIADDGTHCIPIAHWRDGEYLYIHGSNASRLIKVLRAGTQVCISITLVDGLVLAKSAFNHSMHYRSAVIYGKFEEVQELQSKMDALDVFMDKIAEGRKDEARKGNVKEFAATSVMRIPLNETAVKVSNSGPSDKEEDMQLPVWTGVVPILTRRGEPVDAVQTEKETAGAV